MKKVFLLLSCVFLIGCSAIDTSLETLKNNYYLESVLQDSQIEFNVPKFTPNYIYFSLYNPEVSKTYNSELLIFANNFKKYSNSQNIILLTGYIDSDEKLREFNDLGKKRANEVKSILMQMGVSESVLLINDVGGKQYFNENKSVTDKAKNRSVSIIVLRKNR